MQELVDMLRAMAASCRAIANISPAACAQAVHYTNNGNMPGIRAGIGNKVMVRITVEKENNEPNAPSEGWNSLWVDPTHGEG